MPGLTDDQTVILICVLISAALAYAAVRLWMRGKKFSAIALIPILAILVFVIWFFSTFRIRMF